MALTLKINGRNHRVDVDGDTPLLWVLRDVLGMTGTKFGCGMALCGACTVHIDGVLVALCDQPAMDAAHLQRLIETFRLHPSEAVASAYSGVLGVPAVLPRARFEELSELRGDLGARELLRAASQMVHAVEAPALAFDVDGSSDR